MVNKVFRYSVYAAATLALSTQALTAQPLSVPVAHDVISARLESNKPVYRVGQPIMLRLTLINRTTHDIFFFPGAPYTISDLKVFNAEGTLVPSLGAQHEICAAGCGGHPYTVKLDPGKPVIVEFNDRESHWALREWADIRRWGYDLRTAGSYSLVAFPKVTALSVGTSEFTTLPADKSNKIHITIVK